MGVRAARASRTADFVRLILSPLYLLPRLRWRTEFSLWGGWLPPGSRANLLASRGAALAICGARLLAETHIRHSPQTQAVFSSSFFCLFFF